MLSDQFYECDLSFLTQTSQVQQESRPTYLQLAKKTITQKSLIIDILYVTIGIPGSIFTIKKGTDSLELSDRFQFDHLTASTLKNSVSQAMRICNQAKYIERQSKKLYLSSVNPIIRTFCESIFNYLHEHQQYFSQLIGQFNQLSQPSLPKITLLNIIEILARRNRMMGFIIRCLNSCLIEETRRCQSVRLLDKMWEIEQELLAHQIDDRIQIVKIFKRTLRIFFINVKDWLSMKQIPDQMEFFIMSINSSAPSEYFLHRNQQIDNLKLPKLIENECQSILEIGKTIRFISLFYEDHEQEKLMRFIDLDQQFEEIEKQLSEKEPLYFRKLKQTKISLNDRIKNKNQKVIDEESSKQIKKQEENPYEMFNKVSQAFNINWVTKRQVATLESPSEKLASCNDYGFLFKLRFVVLQTLENINKKCLNFFRTHEDTLISSKQNRIQTALSHTLVGIKKFMLLEQGDFMEEFFNSAEEIIDKQKSQISHNRIYSCIDEAIENSSAKNLPKAVLENVSFDFLKHGQKKAERMRLWVLFCFDLRQQNPINFIFNSGLMQKLKEICNFIIKLKKGQLVLTKIWDQSRFNDSQVEQADRAGGKKLSQQGKLLQKEKIFRISLVHFINSCLSYLLTKIDILWQEYLIKISQVPTVFEIVAQSNDVVTQLQRISINDKVFFNGTMQGLMLVEKYRKLHGLIKDPKMTVPIREVEQLQFELRTVAEILVNMGQLKEIVNYNSFYDRFE